MSCRVIEYLFESPLAVPVCPSPAEALTGSSYPKYQYFPFASLTITARSFIARASISMRLTVSIREKSSTMSVLTYLVPFSSEMLSVDVNLSGVPLEVVFLELGRFRHGDCGYLPLRDRDGCHVLMVGYEGLDYPRPWKKRSH